MQDKFHITEIDREEYFAAANYTDSMRKSSEIDRIWEMELAGEIEKDHPFNKHKYLVLNKSGFYTVYGCKVEVEKL